MALVLSTVAFNGHAVATASYDPTSGIVDLPVVEVLNGASSIFFSAQLQLAGGSEFELISTNAGSTTQGQRNVFDGTTGTVHIPSIVVGVDDFYAKLKIVPGSNPLRFTVDQLVNNNFEGCPSFSVAGPSQGSCVLSGEITSDITLTKNIQRILSGDVFIGGDNTNHATVTINPGTHISGQQGADFLWIRRGPKIMPEGTPDNPVVMSDPLHSYLSQVHH